MIDVDDPADPRLADNFDLRHTPARDAVIVEGTIALEQVAGSPFALRSVLCLPRHLDKVRTIVGDDALVYAAPDAVLQATVGFNLHRGVVAACDRAPALEVDDLLRRGQLFVACERLNDLENLGSLFRNARALGADGVVLDPETADPLNRRSVRVSLGHVLRVPFARADGWPLVVDPGTTVAALAPDGDVDLDACNPFTSGPCVLLVGSEGAGLSDEAQAAADVRVRIPMANDVDSLNVATAAAIALHAITRR